MTDTAQHVEADSPKQPAATSEATHPEPPLERLEADICQLAGQLAAASCRWLMLIAQFDRRGGWAGAGVLSCAHWLGWKCGLAPRAAYENLRVAHALEALPKITAAFAAGTLSYSKVRALTRVATVDTEADLLQVALASPAAQLEAIVRAYRRVQRLSDVNARHEQRYLRYHYAEDGCLVGSFRLDPEDGAAVIAGLRTARECSAGQSSDELTHAQLAPSREQENADALVLLAKAGATALSSQAAEQPAPAEVVLHVDLATLARSEQDTGTALGARWRNEPGQPAHAVRDTPPLAGAIGEHPASAGIGAGTIVPDWYGDPLDLDYAMAVLFSQRRHRATLAAAP